ncbi:HD family phosphohydrolase [Mariprofundus ferrooxydans]|nr:HD family phosphohydrolase [Mariprofundus ferrooxydans]
MKMNKKKMLKCINDLNELGIALSRDKDMPHLLELILIKAKELTCADAGTLFMVTDDNRLRFEVMRTDSLNFAMGGTSGEPIPFEALPLYDVQGNPNLKHVAANTVLSGKTINIPDAYSATTFDFSGTRAFDAKTGYRSTSFLTVPMKNHENKIIGVLELINATDPDSHMTIPFSEDDEMLAESLASQAAVALTNKQLLDEMKHLFESLIKLIATAIDAKSPYTGGHCNRVPVLTMLLAMAADKQLEHFTLDEQSRYELEIAAWLHDCGKVTTPEYIVDKATKLETIFDRIHIIDGRFALLRREAELKYEFARKQATPDESAIAAAENIFHQTIQQLEDDRAFLHHINTGGEFMQEEDQQRVRQIALQTCRDANGEIIPLLNSDEVENLTIAKGTLTSSEREVINNHAVMTIKMLEELPFPEYLKKVPEFAGGHHERMDGKGYPKGLSADQLPMQARIMAIADIFEALTGNRPYKKAMTLSTALKVLGYMKLDNHIDPELFDIFIRDKVYEEYVQKYLKPEQIDHVDESNIPGFQQ